METNPLSEVRNIRRKISSECGDDPSKVFEYYRKHQEESKRSEEYRFLNTPLTGASAAQASEQTDSQLPE